MLTLRELLKPNAVITVSAFCDNLHTAITANFKVAESGYTEGETPSEPTPNVYEQIISELQEIKLYTASTIISGGQFSDGLGDDENGN